MPDYELRPDNWRIWPVELFDRDDPAPDDQSHVQIVALYFLASGQFADITYQDRTPGPQFDPLYAVWGRKRAA